MKTRTNQKNFMAGKHWIIAFIIIGSSYGIYTGIKDLSQSQNDESEWTDADRQILVENCIRDSKDMAVKHPGLTREYCNCSFDKILSRFTKTEYVDMLGKPIEEQKLVLIPVFQNCLTDYRKKVNDPEQ